MSWKLSSDRPIYAQIIENFQMDIVSGVYRPGDRLPSVRDFAYTISVNPNTMQKAFSELERMGLVYTKRTNGRYITEDAHLISSLQEELAKHQIHIFLHNMKKLGFNKSEVEQLLLHSSDYIE